MNHDYPYWRILYSYEDRSTGGAKSTYAVMCAPTATDALTIFEKNSRIGQPSPPPRYFNGAERIDVCTTRCGRCGHPEEAHRSEDETPSNCKMPDCHHYCAGFKAQQPPSRTNEERTVRLSRLQANIREQMRLSGEGELTKREGHLVDALLTLLVMQTTGVFDEIDAKRRS